MPAHRSSCSSFPRRLPPRRRRPAISRRDLRKWRASRPRRPRKKPSRSSRRRKSRCRSRSRPSPNRPSNSARRRRRRRSRCLRRPPRRPTPGAAVQTPATFIRWQSALAAHLERFKRYPTAARAHGEQGIAKVAFTIDHEGHLLRSQIVQSSGSPLLDQETLDMLARAQPMPRAARQRTRQRLVVRRPRALQHQVVDCMKADRCLLDHAAGATESWHVRAAIRRMKDDGRTDQGLLAAGS